MARVGIVGRWAGVALVAVVAIATRGPSAPGQFGGMGLPSATPAGSKVYFDTSHSADALLRNAENHVRSGDYAEAVDIYLRVGQQFADKVVEVPAEAVGGSADSRLSVNARRECQRRIAALPAEARLAYRARVDAQAERWFRQGEATRDRGPLRKVVDQAFCSSWGDDALDLLGDLAFQEGQFAEALGAYSQLLPDRPGGAKGLTHPDPSVDLARVAAKKLLCRAAIGEHPPSAAELEAFALAQPDGASSFAGRKGPIGKVLADAIRDDHFAPSSQPDGRWPTFAGSPTRDRIAPGGVDVGSLQWRVDLEPIASTHSKAVRSRPFAMAASIPIPPERLLAYHPIVVGDQVLVADDKQVHAYNLGGRPADGASASTKVEPAWKTPDLMGSAASSGRIGGGLARYTLTAQGHRAFARMGQPPYTPIAMNRMGMGGMGFPSPSLIVALDRTNNGNPLWKREASEISLPKRRAEGGSRSAVFEGSPVADAHNVYVAMTDRIEMTATYVVCLDAESGATKWVRYVCEANANADPFQVVVPEIGHRLLTLDGPTIYFQTNLGAVASLDAETGGIRWLATYPWNGRMGGGAARERDLNPAIVHDGLVIVAPDDSPSIYAFDAATGRLAWKTDPIPDEVRLAHLLGVAKGRLIASGDRVLWFDLKDGKLVHAWPDNSPAVQGYGRGLLAGDKVYWPTKTEIHVLDQESGLRADAPIKLQETYQCEGGNLAVGDGYLIVAQSNGLVVFCQNSRLIDRYREEIVRSPDRASNYYRLAQAAEAIGRDDLALESLGSALDRAKSSEVIDGASMADATLDHRRRLLMKLGRKAKGDRDWPTASLRFEAAAAASRSDRDRLAARLELADVQLARGEPKSSVATLQSLLADERLRALTVDATDGHRTIRADILIAERLANLLRDRGADLYAEFDRAAADLLARGRSEQDSRLIEDVGRSFPAARVVPDAWLALGALHAGQGRPGESARAYKRLLAGPDVDDEHRARALWGLARAYESQKLWSSARDVYDQARGRFAGLKLADLGPGTLGALVAERLARGPFDRLAGGDCDGPGAPSPLRRRKEVRWPEVARPLAADGTAPSAESARVFLAQGRTIRPVDPISGESAWVRDLGGEPVWVGYLADRLIAATRTRLVALGLEKGAVEWQYDLGVGTLGRGGVDPFAREPVAGAGEAAAELGEFRVVGNRVFCLRGDQTLLAFDGDTGLLDWSYAPAAGRLSPRFQVGPRQVVLQARKPNAILVLDTATGRRRAEFPRGDEEEWARDPMPIDDDHVALVLDRRTVALFDTARGVNAWVFRETADQPIFGAPRLLGDAETLLVLHDGRELIRLDAVNGARRWSRLLGTEDLGNRPDAIALGGDRAFVANNGTLASIALGDGSTAWKRPLTGPSGVGWAVALTDRAVAAYPVPSRFKEEYLTTLPMVVRRRVDGELIQRLLFQATVSDLAVRFSPRGVLIATQAGLWALGDRASLDAPARPR